MSRAQERRVYIISDLHIGGTYGKPDDPNDRGFRLMTQIERLADFVQTLAREPAERRVELVINGDFVDFLAERDPGQDSWEPLVPDPDKAVAILNAMMERDRVFFDALAELVRRGHRLTVMLGNHDAELSYPATRAALRDAIGGSHGGDFEFIYDGEAYVVGDALIEHGNRYDEWNVVDFDALRRVRSMQSRRTEVPEHWELKPPPGNFMVADVMNPIKESYGFIDLLKPETDAAIPVLLALEPSSRKRLGRIAKLALRATQFELDTPSLPSFGGDISAGPADSAGDPLRDALDTALGGDAAEFLGSLEGEASAEEDPLDSMGGDISARETASKLLGLAQLSLSSNASGLEERLPALLRALRCVQDDQSFDPAVETYPAYIEAAEDLAKGGFRYVIFGHTHLAKQVPLSTGGTYFNSGTWADLIRFPKEIVAGSDEEALPRLRDFVEDLRTGTLAGWIEQRPTYVRLDVGADGQVADAALCHYADGASV